MKIENIEIEKLIPYEFNNKIHDETQINRIANSIKEFGFLQPVVIDANNIIVVWHGRVEGAKKLWLKEVPCIRAENLTETQIKKYRILDNKLNESGWNVENLKIDIEDLWDFNIGDIELSTEDLFGDLLLDEDEEEPEVEEDEAPEAEKTAKIVGGGDLFILWNHRLKCWDATKLEDVADLMDWKIADLVFTDPPYWVKASWWRSQTKDKLKMKDIENDDLSGNELVEFLSGFICNMPIKKDASVYICYPRATQKEFTEAIKKNGLKIKNCIIRDKKVFWLNGFKWYRPQYEMIYFCCLEDFEWYGDKGQSNIWQISREIKRDEQWNHPTPKPIWLIAKALRNSSKENDFVLDVFGWSGSTLIACEQLKRKCFMMELDPKYVEVIIKRFHKLNPDAEIKCLNRDLDISQLRNED